MDLFQVNVFVPRLRGHPSTGSSGYCQRSETGILGKETKRYLTKAQMLAWSLSSDSGC